MKNIEHEKRRFVIAGVATAIVAVYILRLFVLQVLSDEYKDYADSNALYKQTIYPSRGVIRDRTGEMLVYNRMSYDILVVPREARGKTDTLEFCATLGITREEFDQRMEAMKRRPSYSRYTPQLFMSRLSERDFNIFQEKLFRFPGFSVQHRTIREYENPCAAHILGDIGEVSPADIEKDDYYVAGDYIGKLGVERSYEQQLRGVKGKRILLRDARRRIQGNYKDGAYDITPVPGKDLTLGIDYDLQALGERLLEGKIGSIVAIEPQTGEVLAMVSSPSYDPRSMTGRDRSKMHRQLSNDPMRPLLNRSIMGLYPPGSTFKTTQAATFLSEGIINRQTAYPCHGGFLFKGLRVGCHGHGSPIAIVDAISTSCNGYFCWGLYHMMSNRKKYPTVQDAMNRWRDYMVSMGFGYKLGIDLPGEKRGLIPNAAFYDKAYRGSWNGLTIISISIGQGEVLLTPLQMANMCATIANRGYYITPHVVKAVEGEELDTIYKTRHYTMADEQTYETIIEGMRSAVLHGTCRSANTPDYEVCGKTGTAQNRGKDHSAFMGFAPRENPKIAVAVYVENGGWGATYGVPIGALMMEQYINGKLSEASEAKAADFQSRRIFYGTGER